MALALTRILPAILPPPLAVLFPVRPGGQFWLTIPLKLLGDLPRIVSAVWTIARG